MPDHPARAAALRAQVRSSGGTTDPTLRRAVLAQVGGGPNASEPYAALAKQIADAAYRVTDAQVAEVRRVSGSDKAAYEIIMTAAIGAGLLRFDRAMLVVKDASDAPR